MKVRDSNVFLVFLAACLLLAGACSSSSEDPDGSVEPDGQDGQSVDDDQQDGSSGDDGGSDPGDDQPQDGGGDDTGDSGADEDVDGGGDEDGPTNIGTLSVDCDVPFVLDASQVTSMAYMTAHFDDLVQEYCITTTVGGIDLTNYGEKMYYGSHSPDGTPASDVILSLNQQSMTGMLAPAYSVRVDFQPDTAVTAGSNWTVGVDGEANQAMAIVVKHISLNEMCLFAIGYSGDLTFPAVSNVTQVEGGSFSVAGTMEMANPGDLPGICEIFEGIISCCP